jgi:3-hydroxyacyl-CoA dehydrogenase
VRSTADAKAVVAEILKTVASGSEMSRETCKGRSADVPKVLDQMVEEGIVGRENADGLLNWI